MTILAAPLFDSWKEIMHHGSKLVGLLFMIQTILSVVFFIIWRNNIINSVLKMNAKYLVELPLFGKIVVFWLLSTFIVAPYLSFILDALFVLGFAVLLILPIIYLCILCIKNKRDFLWGEKNFYYIQHFFIQQVIGLIIYIFIYKKKLLELWNFSGTEEEKRFWIEELYPEISVLDRYYNNFIVLLTLFGIVYIVWIIVYAIKAYMNMKK